MKKILFVSLFLFWSLCCGAQIYDLSNYELLWEDLFTGNRSWNTSTFVEQSSDPGFVPRWECFQSEWWPYYVTTDREYDHQAYQTTHAQFGNDNKLHLLTECKSTSKNLKCDDPLGYIIPSFAYCSHYYQGQYYPPHRKVYYHSGMIETINDSSWFGYYEIRCQLPVHPGEGIAFWLFGTGPSTYEEIDIFEHSQGDAEATGNLATGFSCGIWYNPDGTNYSAGNGNAGAQNSSKYYAGVSAANDLTHEHTFGLEWLPNRITWFFDGQVIHDCGDPDIIPQNLLNLRVTNVVKHDAMNPLGSSPYWQGSAEMIIDYIRVYKLISDCNTNIVIQSVNDLTNYSPGVKHNITIGSVNGLSVPTSTNLILRADNSITSSGELTIPIGAEITFMVHPCVNY